MKWSLSPAEYLLIYRPNAWTGWIDQIENLIKFRLSEYSLITWIMRLSKFLNNCWSPSQRNFLAMKHSLPSLITPYHAPPPTHTHCAFCNYVQRWLICCHLSKWLACLNWTRVFYILILRGTGRLPSRLYFTSNLFCN